MNRSAMSKSAPTDAIRQQLKEVATEVKNLGGYSGFSSGEWLFHLMEKTFRNFSVKAITNPSPSNFPAAPAPKFPTAHRIRL